MLKASTTIFCFISYRLFFHFRQAFLSNGIKEIINKTIQQIKNNLNKNVQIKVTYFIPDRLKSGGKYQTEVGIVAKINEYSKIIKLETDTEIPIEEIIELEILKNA